MVQYHSVVLFVENIESAKQFYCEFLALPIEMDMGKNVMLKGGITLWEISGDNIILKKLGNDNITSGNRSELYFETNNLDEVRENIRKYGYRELHGIHEEPWGQKTIRFFDCDQNIVEIGEELKTFLSRMVKEGWEINDLCSKTGMKINDIERVLDIKL